MIDWTSECKQKDDDDAEQKQIILFYYNTLKTAHSLTHSFTLQLSNLPPNSVIFLKKEMQKSFIYNFLNCISFISKLISTVHYCIVSFTVLLKKSLATLISSTLISFTTNILRFKSLPVFSHVCFTVFHWALFVNTLIVTLGFLFFADCCQSNKIIYLIKPDCFYLQHTTTCWFCTFTCYFAK